MIAKASSDNRLLTWLLRGGGLLALFIGLRLILAPLAVLADVLPLLGSVVGAGLSLIAALLAGITGGIVIALAWLVYRPLFGLLLLIPVAVLTAGPCCGCAGPNTGPGTPGAHRATLQRAPAKLEAGH